MLHNLISLQSQLMPGLTDGATADAAEKTGSIAKEVAELKTMSLQDLINRLADSAVSFAINLAIAILVFYAGRFVIRKIYNFVSSIFLKREIDRSLSVFVLSLINMVLYFILIVTVIGILGIQTTSFLALFASAGVAIGMALSGTLQNFAGGVLILLLKPYKIGDYIEAQGYAGTVKEIQIFFTVITTADNKSITIPNGGLSTGSVNNWTREDYRRVSWTVSISYGDNVGAARDAILRMFAADPRIMPSKADADAAPVPGEAADNGTSVAAEPVDNGCAGEERRTLVDRLLFRKHKIKGDVRGSVKHAADISALLPKPDFTPKVFVGELAASSVDLHVRAWTLTKDYWGVFYDYNERFYNELPACGVSFPFPQLDVHLPSREA
ncbi:MAG: mechanosensitive ion channel family protein [Muribaculaceae bacterium]|nr:mechanosensitive ion channel family protein [Muribaculaceae bacterium]